MITFGIIDADEGSLGMRYFIVSNHDQYWSEDLERFTTRHKQAYSKSEAESILAELRGWLEDESLNGTSLQGLIKPPTRSKQ